MGIDVWEVIDAAATKPFGFMPFYPGPGLGGHCIPIDPFYLTWKAREYEFHTKFIELAGEINSNMPYYVVAARSSEALNERRRALNGAKVLVLGVAYKKDIDDCARARRFEVIELLEKAGAEVATTTPTCPRSTRGHGVHAASAPARKSVDLSDERVADADAVVVLTDHTAHRLRATSSSSAQLVVDFRNVTSSVPASDKVWKL